MTGVQTCALPISSVADAVKGADFVMILMPDEHIAAAYKADIEPNLKEGAVLAFAHGFNVHYGQVQPRADLDVVMVAPKGPWPHGAWHLRRWRRCAHADRRPPGQVRRCP